MVLRRLSDNSGRSGTTVDLTGGLGLKSIILADGSGMRMYSFTSVTSKRLLSVCNGPMVYYPLFMFMLAGSCGVPFDSTAEYSVGVGMLEQSAFDLPLFEATGLHKPDEKYTHEVSFR